MIATTKAEKEAAAIDRIQRGLKCSREEATEVYLYDMAVDKGEATEHDLPADKAKAAQQYAHTGTRKVPTAYKFEKKARKENATKGGIITALEQFLREHDTIQFEDVTVTNKERQIAFRIGTDNYELTLVQKRKPK